MSDAAPVPGLDLPVVLEWLDRAAPGTLSRRSTRARMITGGRSNLTYLLDDGARKVVLRRPPLGHVLATAHDMGREYRVIRALASTPVPVPAALARCDDAGVTGAPFYLMEHVEGRVLRAADDVAGLDADARSALALEMVDVLARLHGLDPAEVGLAGHGRPEGYLERQLRRWGAQLDSSRSRHLPEQDDLLGRLAGTVPVSGPASILHGDYRLDNLITAPPDAPDAGRVRAVLDWEMSTLGDPLADLGLLLAYWDVVSALDHPGVRSIGPASGFPPGDRLVARYAQRRPGTDLSDLAWYVAFGLFKIGVVLEGIHYRYGLGRTVGDGFDRIGEMVPPIVSAGLQTLAGRGTGPA